MSGPWFPVYLYANKKDVRRLAASSYTIPGAIMSSMERVKGRTYEPDDP
jgi:hypothetical protein